MNIFTNLITTGKIITREDIKYYFRILAMKLHPDTSQSIFDNSAFIKLKNDFDESLTLLPDNIKSSCHFTRKDFYSTFWDIESSGFPVDISIKDTTPFYNKRIASLNEIVNYLNIIPGYSFIDVANDLYKIRGDNIIDNPLFGTVRMIFYNLITWYLGPKRFTRLALEKWYSQIKDDLVTKEYLAFHDFLKWLIEDLDNGAALIRK
jgi:hypothetical protein